MDTHLKLLAEASLTVTEAEEAIGETAYQTARDALDRAEEHLAELRAGWPTMNASERTVVGTAAAPVKQRLDAAARRIPTHTTLAAITEEPDPEQEIDPAA